MKTASMMRIVGAVFTLGVSLTVNGQTEAEAALDTQRAAFRQALDVKLTATDSPAERLEAVREFRRQQQSSSKAQLLKLESQSRPPIPYIREVDIPSEAGPAMEELIVQQAYVRNQQIWLANALRQNTPTQRQSALSEWRQASKPALAALEARTVAVKVENPAKPSSLPSSPQIPAGTSDEMRQAILKRHADVTRFIQSENTRRAQTLSEGHVAVPAPASTKSVSKTINLQP
jgi:hypothetical protein